MRSTISHIFNSCEKPRLYSSRIIDRKYSFVDVNEILTSAGMEPYEVADQGHWFTSTQVERFHRGLLRATGNPGIAREAGRYALSPDSLGVMRQYILGLVGPANAFSILKKLSTKFTRASAYESRRLGPTRIEVTVVPYAGVHEERFLCENRMGFFESIFLAFGREIPLISHTECVFHGHAQCCYTITWESTISERLRGVRNLLALPFAALSGISLVTMPWLAIETILPITGAVLMGLTLLAGNREKRELRGSLAHLRDSTDRLIEQMDMNYNNALTANEIGRAISRQTTIDNVLSSVVQVLQDRLDYDRGMILLEDPLGKRLCFRAGFGYQNHLKRVLEDTSFLLNRTDTQGIFVASFREQRPFLINDVNEMNGRFARQSLEFAHKIGAQSFIAAPIICEGKSYGVLVVDNRKSRRPLVQSDLNFLMGIAPAIGVSLRNAELLEESQRQFSSILKVLAASIDARDPLTAGHSDKVTEYALGICDELDMSSEFREMVRVAALLHDYGKIGIPDSILKKDGRLTPEEYEVVKAHTSKAQEILGQVEFHGLFRDVPQIAACHHEKMDGTGYPGGLRGPQIPLAARIVGVADFFEAITSKRHYRDPMSLDEAFDLLQRESDSRFDPRVVDAMITYYVKTYLRPGSQASEPRCVTRRRDVRVRWDDEVSFLLDGQCLRGYGRDISAHGCYIACNAEGAREGAMVGLEFHLDNHLGSAVSTAARISWVNSGTKRKKPVLPEGFGVEFLDASVPETVRTFIEARGPRPASDAPYIPDLGSRTTVSDFGSHI